MRQADIAARLVLIEERLTRIEALLAGRKLSQALADIEASYGLVGQLVEVAHAQREQIEALIRRLDTLIKALADHDQRLVMYGDANEAERHDLHELMVQLRELARRQVRSHEDLVRELGGDAWDGVERRMGSIVDRRRREN